MDFITQLPLTKQGNDSILVMVDTLSKMVHFIPTKTMATAPKIAELFFKNIFHLHGLPRAIISNRDTKFTSWFWQTLFKLTGVKLSISMAFHPKWTDKLNKQTEHLKTCYEPSP